MKVHLIDSYVVLHSEFLSDKKFDSTAVISIARNNDHLEWERLIDTLEDGRIAIAPQVILWLLDNITSDYGYDHFLSWCVEEKYHEYRGCVDIYFRRHKDAVLFSRQFSINPTFIYEE